MSHKSTIRLLDKVGENHDAKVLKWKQSLTEHLKTIKVKVAILIHFNDLIIMYTL